MSRDVQPRQVRRTPGRSFADDGALVAQARVDPQAFGVLYDRHVDDIYGYCALRLGSREAAEDATSLIFAKALAGLPRLRGPSFRAWLFGIAHHVVVDVYRSTRPSLSLDAALHLDDPSASPERSALDDEATQILHAALSGLSPDQRQVIELRLAGLTTAEISSVLQRSRGTISVAHHRAVRRLRTLLDSAGTEGPDV